MLKKIFSGLLAIIGWLWSVFFALCIIVGVVHIIKEPFDGSDIGVIFMCSFFLVLGIGMISFSKHIANKRERVTLSGEMGRSSDEWSILESIKTWVLGESSSGHFEQPFYATANDAENQQTSQNADISLQLLDAAMAHKGRITAAEASLELSINFEVVKREFEALASQGACQVTVGEKGIIVYYFPEFEDDGHKKGTP